jgi:PAS domain S-box-containing protein
LERVPFVHRIGTRIYAGLLAVAVLAAAATGTALLNLSSRTLRASISQRNLQIARRAANEVDLYLDNSLRELRALAEMLSPLPDPWVQDALLENLVLTLRRFRSISLVDSDGRPIASSVLDRSDKTPLDAWAVAAGGGIYISAVWLSAERLPYLTVALPAGRDGESGRTLLAELSLRDIWDLVDDIAFGSAGRALLLSSAGVLIAHPDKTLIVAGPTPDRQMWLLAEPGAVSVAKPSKGPPLLLAVAPVQAADWRLIVQQPLAEAYLPLREVALRSVLLLVAVLTAAVLASLVIARRISGPLGLLLAGTLRIGQGDLAYRIPVAGRDEIGRLSASFNRMVEQLNDRSVRLGESEERYRLMTESVEDIIFSLDNHGRVLVANPRAAVVSGYSRESLTGRPCLTLLSRPSRCAVRERLRRQGSAQGSLELEVELVPRAGSRRLLEVHLVQARNSADRLQLYGVARDITERKAAETRLLANQEQLRSLASELSLAEARERKRIASDLHDRIGQALALAKIRLGALRSRNGSLRNRQIEQTMALIDQTITEVRGLIFDLSSPLLYQVGLRAALEQLAEQLEEQHAVRIRVDGDLRSLPLDGDVPVMLFQAARELIVNALKHARARSIYVTLAEADGELRLGVSDDGAGFDTGEEIFRPGRRGGFGLFSIGERLRYLGGRVEIDSRPGRGTRISLALALERATIGGDKAGA